MILSENEHRRHMTKGQRAMAVAMLYPDGQQGKKASFATNEVAGSSIRKARLVLRVLPEQAKGVLAGRCRSSDRDKFREKYACRR